MVCRVAWPLRGPDGTSPCVRAGPQGSAVLNGITRVVPLPSLKYKYLVERVNLGKNHGLTS